MQSVLALLLLWPLAAGVISMLPLSHRLRNLLLPAAALVQLGLSCILWAGNTAQGTISLEIPGLCMYGLSFAADGFRALWCLLTAFAFFCACWFTPGYFTHALHRRRYDAATLLTLFGTAGVFLSADLFTLFVFFEIMSLSSWVWVAHEDNPAARYAADAYLAIAVLGGLTLLMGLFLLHHLVGTLQLDALAAACAPFAGTPALYLAGALLLLGFGAKAGMFPLHFWLPMAHPVAPAPASALLSGVLTKCGVFGILILACNLFFADARWGEIVLLLGVITMLTGAVLALFATDLKRTLACSSVSQIGFILLGAGLIDILGSGSELAARGTVLHMLNHCLIKTVLFLAAGVFAHCCGSISLNRLRGAGRRSPVLMFCLLIGCVNIAGVPFTSGYVSKTLLHEAITLYVELNHHILQARLVEWLFLLAGGMTVAYMTKLFVILFLERPAADVSPVRLDKATGILILPAAVLLVLGMTPYLTLDRIAASALPFLHINFSETIVYQAPVNLFGAAVSLIIGALLYVLLIRRYLTENGLLLNRWPVWLDLERLIYRPLVMRILPAFFGFLCRCLDQLTDGIILLLRRTLLRPAKPEQAPVAAFAITDQLGHLLDRLAALRHRKPQHTYLHLFAHWEKDLTDSARLIGASLSFGLLMFCLGLCLTLLYLLL